MTLDIWATGRAFGLFFVTAIAELLGCYLPLLWLTGKGTSWLLVPAALSLAVFVWLLALHPAASGRVYATHWFGFGWSTALHRLGTTGSESGWL